MNELRKAIRNLFEEEPEARRLLPSLGGGWFSHNPVSRPGPPYTQLTPQWDEKFRKALGQLVGTVTARRAEHRRIEELAGEMNSLKTNRRRPDHPGSVIVPITTLEPEPFDLLQTIYVVVQPSDDEYLCSFFDANVNASGCTETDAVGHLKEVMLDLFEHLSVQPAKRLGPGPAKQLAVLKAFIRKRA
jgi:hypothetical protein